MENLGVIPGFDYGSKRYGNKSGCNSPARHKGTKKVTNRAERRVHRNNITSHYDFLERYGT